VRLVVRMAEHSELDGPEPVVKEILAVHGLPR
jgi:hypothetical protein